MTRPLPAYCDALGEAFGLGSRCLAQRVHGSGHIHETIYAAYASDDGVHEVIHQRVNTGVFTTPHAVMHNIAHVTCAVTSLQQARYPDDWMRRVLRIITTPSGDLLYCDPQGAWWRTYHYVRDSVAFDRISSPKQAFAAARAFGEFSSALASYEGPALHETIVGFHDTPARWQSLLRAVRDDNVQRVAHVARELTQLEELAHLCDRLTHPLASGELPTRIAHNDTKINNVLFDAQSGEPLCVVDLDTVMPGTSLFDFGDLVRSSTSRLAEDSDVGSDERIDEGIFEALVRGWVAACGTMMNAAERELLVISAQVLTFEVAVRFLTDYLLGDVYFRISHPRHNYQRCRAQLALVAALVRQHERLQKIADRVCNERKSTASRFEMDMRQ